MYSILFNKENSEKVFDLKARGVSGRSSKVVWGTPVDYMLVKHFVDKLNEHGLPEELFEATHDFLVEVDRLGE